MAPTEEQEKAIQGIGIAGFRKDHQELIGVHFGSELAGQDLIGFLEHVIASAWEVRRFNELFREISTRSGTDGTETVQATWSGLLLSASGLAILGVGVPDPAPSEGFTAFSQGMAARAQQVGDTREQDAPTAWGHPEFVDRVDALIVIAADEIAELHETAHVMLRQILQTGNSVVFDETGRVLPGSLRGHEHFGFKDGISQPAIIGWDADPAQGEPAAVQLGEFVLGYPDNGGEAVAVGDFWRDGSFCVFRRLHQDVMGFRQQTSLAIAGADPTVGPADLAAKMVGRWPSGTPLATHPETDVQPPEPTNAFAFLADDDPGLKTPRWAHIRKANPRDETVPEADPTLVSRHRMLRRGLPFGPPLPRAAVADDGEDRGLHFLAFMADIARQFEFVQRQWLNDPNFPNGRLDPSNSAYGPPQTEPGDGADPIVGEHDVDAVDVFRQTSGAHPFPLAAETVTLTGGGYFFAPSLSAVSSLAKAP